MLSQVYTLIDILVSSPICENRYYSVQNMDPVKGPLSTALCTTFTVFKVYGMGFLTTSDYQANFAAHDASEEAPKASIILGSSDDPLFFHHGYKHLNCTVDAIDEMSCTNIPG